MQQEEHCLERKQGIFPLPSLYHWNLTTGFHLRLCHSEMNAGKQKAVSLITQLFRGSAVPSWGVGFAPPVSSLQTRPLLHAGS